MKSETVLAARDAESEALGMIERAARDPAVDISKFERLVALRNQERAFLAEQRFNERMNEVQSLNLRVERESRNSHTNSTYARLEAVNAVVVPAYSSKGFSMSFGTIDCPIKDHYRMICDVSNAGHTKRFQCDLPSDVSGPQGRANKAAIQGFGSTMSYGRRYLTKLIFNVCEVDDTEDDDGVSASGQKPKGPNSLMADRSQPESQVMISMKKKLVDLTRSVHLVARGYALDDYAKRMLNQWLIDESMISDTETLSELGQPRLAEVVAKISSRLP